MGTQPKSRSRTQLRQGAAPLLGTVPAIVSARQFWTIVLASLLLGGANSANADDTEDTGLPKNADQTPEEQEPSAQPTNIDTESAEDNLNGQQTDKTESNKDTFSASTPSSDSSAAIPLSDERLAAMVRQWLGLKQDYQSTQLLAASLGTTPSAVAPKVESAEEARQAFRDLFNEEIQRQGGVLLSDADGVEKTKSDFDFNPTYLLGLLGLAGGGGGGAAAIKPVIALLSGNVVKGYLQGAVVWRDGNGDGKFNWNDTNQNGIVDTNEVIGDFFALTDSQGRFSNLGGTGAINVFGGVDLYGTGLAFNGVLSAPDATSNAVITPLTTIVQAMSLPGESATDAATRVIKLLGLDQNPALGIKASDLLTVDPISLALTGGADSVKALTIYGKAAQVANLLLQ